MIEKSGLDKKVFVGLFEKLREPKYEKKTHQKVKMFIENSPKCKNFCCKQGEINSRIYWCKKFNHACNFALCPKIKGQNC